ncbi:50S ribosomal protein L25/general stress protein Ctc [Trueperella bialowiezensis]|uniref:Large ribosomal subunit protein bL25 n=1 Tax=Trueperella bialowiezensis TaxID=312285 RepID=A0A3S5EW09_9ACTO|nr:50S ribosomal protein L25/general stress protein Ctc [Trueperella bialowiezensis]VEI13018.1 General stress protein CTC [Trueperella bialowiezensis]
MASKTPQLETTARNEFGKGASRRLRRDGLLPVVVYGHGEDPIHLTVNYHDAFLIVRGNPNALMHLLIDGDKQLVIVKDIQRNPLTRLVEHLDLLRVKADEKVLVEVPVEIVGEPFGIAIATLELMTLPVEAPVTDIPETIVVDVEDLKDGENVTIADMKFPEGVTTELEADEVVVVVAEPQEVELPEPEEGAEEEGEGAAEADADEAGEEE